MEHKTQHNNNNLNRFEKLLFFQLYHVNVMFIKPLECTQLVILNIPEDFNKFLFIKILTSLEVNLNNDIIDEMTYFNCKNELKDLMINTHEYQDELWFFYNYKLVLDKYLTGNLKYVDKYFYNDDTNELYYMSYPNIINDISNLSKYSHMVFTFNLNYDNWMKVNSNFYNQ